MILTSSQMTGAEEAAFARGATAGELMEVAGRSIADMVVQFHPSPGTCHVFAGKGHNAGDVLVAARHLGSAGWRITLEMAFPASELAPLTAAQLAGVPVTPGAPSGGPLVVLDGLLGIGSSGAPREPVAGSIRKINNLRKARGAWVLAADLPSGLNADDGSTAGDCVRADATIAMGFLKSGLITDSAAEFVGRLAIATLPDLVPPSGADPAGLITPDSLSGLLPPRSFDVHKGLCGRVAVVAGSSGLTGAARLCSHAAVSGGAGLVTLFVPREIHPIMATSAIPEVMVRPVDSLLEVLDFPFDVLAIGPGIGSSRADEVVSLLHGIPVPAVIDADALNILSAGHMDLAASPAGPRLLTPHPGEMQRLFPQDGRTRRGWLEAFVAAHPVTLLLKGSRTIIGEAGSPPSLNSTGHPGMASGGMGDVLTGVCAALIAQGHSTRDAALAGAWVCGRAAEIAITRGESQESLRASAVLAHLGMAFNSLRAPLGQVW
jgi:NAD(P)H-hydrate epimerase